jgi:predicted nucleic acid-binding protein
MRYLLDTNIIAEPTKPQPNQEVRDRLTQVAGYTDCLNRGCE